MTAILQKPSPNFDDRGPDGLIDMLVLHYTGMESANAALERLCDRHSKVSAHYLIDEDGTVWQLVAEENRAWHAGLAYWRGETNINARSIGIELVNPGHEFGYRPFPEPQMKTLRALSQNILMRHPIEARNVVGHADVAPSRKEDPGELFDWAEMASHGIGLWPEADGPQSAGDPKSLLGAIGFDVADLAATLRAFQRHYRPLLISGEQDLETEMLIRRLAYLTGAGESVV